MNATTGWELRSTGGAARRGAVLGLWMVLGYGLAFALYAVVRSSLQIAAVLAPDEHLVGTLLASGASILVTSTATAALLAIVAVVVETITLGDATA